MKLRCLGLMSGMSMDGIDAAVVDITYKNKKFKFDCIGYNTYPYSPAFRKKIIRLGYGKRDVTLHECAKYNMELGSLFGNAAKKIMDKHADKKVDVIGSHGQTIYYSDKVPVSTVQIGEGSVIAQITGVTTVSDIRQADIAAGGLGAPLAPTFHYHFFRPFKKTVAVINIGSISNITFIDPSKGEESVIGFDMGPGNILIDTAMRTLFNKQYDRNGVTAKKGELIKELYNQIINKARPKKKPPKSIGFVFGSSYAESLIDRFKRHKKEDIIHTVTKVSADIMARNIFEHLPHGKLEEIIFCGGGAHNASLLGYFKSNFPDKEIKKFTDYGINVDAVEAVFMAFIAFSSVNRIPITLPGTTGAKEKTVLGKISPVPLDKYKNI